MVNITEDNIIDEAKLERIDKGGSLFKFLKEVYITKSKMIPSVKREVWWKYFSDIPVHDSLMLYNPDEEEFFDEGLESLDGAKVIMKVTRPYIESAPKPCVELEEWVIDWDKFIKEIAVIEKREIEVETDDGVEFQDELFVSDDFRVAAFIEYKKIRDSWAKEQRLRYGVQKLYDDLHRQYINLNRESDIIELCLGQGILSLKEYPQYEYPLITKPVKIHFQADKSIIYILDLDTTQSFSGNLLQSIESLNSDDVEEFTSEVVNEQYNILNKNAIGTFLAKVVNMLHSSGKYYSESVDYIYGKGVQVAICNKPVLFIRKRPSGVVEAMNKIVKQLEETGELSAPLQNLVGIMGVDAVGQTEELDFAESIARLNGEDVNILLSKEANGEQLDIAERIEKHNAVLVQGPPGTGKTHTIANLLGHFLAQGKNVLVTSHTKKALTVVKDKVDPRLRELCVAMLDDDNRDVEKAVNNITEKMSRYSAYELKHEAEELKRKRDALINELSKARNLIYQIKNAEYETVTYEGKGYTLSEVAKFVCDNKERVCEIPGKVKSFSAMPLTYQELVNLYSTNGLISSDEEKELNSNLPNASDLLKPTDFIDLLDENRKLESSLKNLADDYKIEIVPQDETFSIYYHGEELANTIDVAKLEQLMSKYKERKNKNTEEWEVAVILAEKKGQGYVKPWKVLAESITELEEIAENSFEIMLGFDINVQSDYIDKKNLDVLSSLGKYFATGKKLPKFFVKKEYKECLDKILINGKSIETSQDCDKAFAYMNLVIKRKEVGFLWDNLVQKHGGVSFESLGDNPEDRLSGARKSILKHLSWYTDVYQPIIKDFKDADFNVECLGKKDVLASVEDEIRQRLYFVDVLAPKLLDVIRINNVDIPFNISTMQFYQKKLAESASSSVYCSNLYKAYINKDVVKYSGEYNSLIELCRKKELLEIRKFILQRLEEIAPGWAKAVSERLLIHGETTPPENIELSWQWKVFAAKIEEVTKEPFEEMQKKAVKYGEMLREYTAKLAEKQALYHLLARIEKDISQKQALQGWELIVRKIGKGTGKRAQSLRLEARKQMAKCQAAVPAWIMNINQALTQFDPTKNKFDIVIIDEASQSDISALAILYFAKKIIIVGDDEQVSPSAVGSEIEIIKRLVDQHLVGKIVNPQIYDLKTSIYDLAKTTFPTLMLKEHFRCVPSIIGYSNQLSYENKIKPLRDDGNSLLKPATVAYKVDGHRSANGKKNEIEARTIVSLIMACMNQPEYDGKTFGVISMIGDEQAALISDMLLEKLDMVEYENRKIMCGNAAQFQGDERDVIFLSMVDSNENDGPMRLVGVGSGNSTKQRYNVAASRARDQLWVVHSLDVYNDLKSDDMRRGLIEYVSNPTGYMALSQSVEKQADSPFEVAVARALISKGYHIKQQWKVGSYRIDMVAMFEGKKIAIECDGELYHSGTKKIQEDMQRQAILERLGWNFIRIRGSEYYRSPEETMERVFAELQDYGIMHEANDIEIESNQESELMGRLNVESSRLLQEWYKDEADQNELDSFDIYVHESACDNEPNTISIDDIINQTELKKEQATADSTKITVWSAVSHTLYGDGYVAELEDDYIVVEFDMGNAKHKFNFPDVVMKGELVLKKHS